MKFYTLLIFSIFIAFSCSNPIEINLQSVVSVIYKNVKNNTEESSESDASPSEHEIEYINEVPRSCVLEELKISELSENPTLTIENITEFEAQSLKNKKIIKAINQATQLCFLKKTFDGHYEAQMTLIFYLVTLRDLAYDNSDCQKLRLQQLDPGSKILENFTTTATIEECGSGVNSNMINSTIETETENFKELDIKSCTFEEFSVVKKMRTMELSFSIVGDDGTDEDIKLLIDVGKRTLARLGENELECLLSDLSES
jgi:hypothetical protein